MMPVFRVLARMKRLRGTAFDVFGRTEERRIERAMIESYKVSMISLAKQLSPQNYAMIVEIAKLPLGVRGFGPVKAENLRKAKVREQELMKSLSPTKGDSLRAAAE
jgi:indolepyruvate ferredoxin oxidoreductase